MTHRHRSYRYAARRMYVAAALIMGLACLMTSLPAHAETAAKASLASRIWHYPLYRDALEVRAVSAALFVLIVGMAIGRRMARRVHGALERRAHVEENAAATIERVVYYAWTAMVVMFALHLLAVPLTAFTLFGGAVALGIGLGVQHLVNNFISGLILMVERPIRVGDIIEVDGERGRVEAIAARCSHVRLATGVDVLVPNSVFLERKTVNWTLSGRRHRHAIELTVPQSASAREVEALLLQAASEHSDVLSEPAPVVLFTALPGATMIFEVHFWLEMAPNRDARVVCSELRFRIDALCREAGIYSPAAKTSGSAESC